MVPRLRMVRPITAFPVPPLLSGYAALEAERFACPISSPYALMRSVLLYRTIPQWSRLFPDRCRADHEMGYTP